MSARRAQQAAKASADWDWEGDDEEWGDAWSDSPAAKPSRGRPLLSSLANRGGGGGGGAPSARPPARSTSPVSLALGAVAKQDTTYLNGQQIGASGSEKANCGDYLHFRSYDVPAGLLKPSANVLAVRVFSEPDAPICWPLR